jgi:hypothetical protein
MDNSERRSLREDRWSQSFFIRDLLDSEIARINGMVNLPDDPDIAIAAVAACANIF